MLVPRICNRKQYLFEVLRMDLIEDPKYYHTGNFFWRMIQGYQKLIRGNTKLTKIEGFPQLSGQRNTSFGMVIRSRNPLKSCIIFNFTGIPPHPLPHFSRAGDIMRSGKCHHTTFHPVGALSRPSYNLLLCPVHLLRRMVAADACESTSIVLRIAIFHTSQISINFNN